METSEERAAIAKALRGDPTATLVEQTRDGFEGMTYHEAAYRFWDMCRRVRSVANVDISNGTTSVLADLIDPTCKNKLDELNRMAPVEMRTDNFVCSACGETFCADPDGVNFPIDWAYCPNCGARVVRDDD
jgi:predicted RNA-binding Zn-ribbon protein involved in translation (DUF1610 family)